MNSGEECWGPEGIGRKGTERSGLHRKGEFRSGMAGLECHVEVRNVMAGKVLNY